MTFFNRNIKQHKRFEKEKCEEVKPLIYEEEYLIEGSDCSFEEVVEGKSVEQLFGPFQIDLMFNKLLFED